MGGWEALHDLLSGGIVTNHSLAWNDGADACGGAGDVLMGRNWEDARSAGMPAQGVR